MTVPNPSKKIVAVLSDLMFTVKIQEAAKRAGMDAVFVKSKHDALAKAREGPVALILDLNDAGTAPLELISALKSDAGTCELPLLGYVSHVQMDMRQAAQEKGCDVVVARSAFVQNLPALLERFRDASNLP